MVFPNYSISLETASGLVNTCGLHKEILEAGPFTPEFQGILTSEDDDEITLLFDETPPAGEISTCDNVVAAHPGICVYRTVFIESDQILANGISVTGDLEWEELGGQPTNIEALLVANGFLATDIQYVVGRVICEAKVSGDGAQLAIYEHQEGVEKALCAPYDIADTDGEWKIAKVLTTTAPSVGEATYCFEGRLNGATSLEIRRAAVTVLYVGP